MSKVRAVAQIIPVALLSAFLLIILYLLAGQVFMRGSLPKIFGYAQVAIVSGSMEPALEAGDLLVIREEGEYEIEDIITYRSGNTLITHRVIAVEGTKLITKGDANNVADPPIILNQVEGRMQLRIPKVGRIALLLKTPTGILITVMIGLILIIFSYKADRRKGTE